MFKEGDRKKGIYTNKNFYRWKVTRSSLAAYLTLKFRPTSFNNAVISKINVKEIDHFPFY